MSRSKPFSNPFYFVLIVVGVAFVITACGYAVLAARGSAVSNPALATSPAGQGFLDWMDEYGFTALMIELVLLAVTTFAAIATDEYWGRAPAAGNAEHAATTAPQTEPVQESHSNQEGTQT